MARSTPATVSRFEPICAALILAVLGAVCLRPSIRGNDGVGNYVYLASLLRGGDLDFADEYALFDARRDYSFKFSDLPKSPVTGKPSNRYGVGSALLWAPFALPLHLALLRIDPPLADGATRPYEWAVGVGSAFWGSLALWLVYRRLRTQYSVVASTSSIAALIFATPLGFYLYAHGSMSHAIGFLAATGLMLGFERFWKQPSVVAAILCGAFAALLTITRFQDAPWALLVAAGVAFRSLGLGHRLNSEIAPILKLKILLAFSLAALAFFTPQLLAWKILYGSWLSGPLPYLDSSAGTFSLLPARAFDALFSERHGALAWHPIIAAGLIALAFQLRPRSQNRPLAILGLAGFAALAWVVGGWSMWWAGASFGNRFFISALPYVALGLAPLFEDEGRRWRRPVALLSLMILILWNLGLLYQYATEMIPREEQAPWPQLIRQNIVDVPKRILKID